MSHIFQKNATKFETRITRHETTVYATIPYAMLCVSVYSPILSTKIRCFLSLHSSVQTGIPVLHATALS